MHNFPLNTEMSLIDCGSSPRLPSPSLLSLSRSSRLSESPTIRAVSAAWCVKRVWMECLSPWTWRTTSTASRTTTRKEDDSLLMMFSQCVSESSCGRTTCVQMRSCQSLSSLLRFNVRQSKMETMLFHFLNL